MFKYERRKIIRNKKKSIFFQCRNGIIDGTHPVTSDEAIQFSGLQCQIQFGDYDESKHKPGIIE